MFFVIPGARSATRDPGGRSTNINNQLMILREINYLY
jgi:hypothetical protein